MTPHLAVLLLYLRGESQAVLSLLTFCLLITVLGLSGFLGLGPHGGEVITSCELPSVSSCPSIPVPKPSPDLCLSVLPPPQAGGWETVIGSLFLSLFGWCFQGIPPSQGVHKFCLFRKMGARTHIGAGRGSLHTPLRQPHLAVAKVLPTILEWAFL